MLPDMVLIEVRSIMSQPENGAKDRSYLSELIIRRILEWLDIMANDAHQVPIIVLHFDWI